MGQVKQWWAEYRPVWMTAIFAWLTGAVASLAFTLVAASGAPFLISTDSSPSSLLVAGALLLMAGASGFFALANIRQQISATRRLVSESSSLRPAKSTTLKMIGLSASYVVNGGVYFFKMSRFWADTEIFLVDFEVAISAISLTAGTIGSGLGLLVIMTIRQSREGAPSDTLPPAVYS